MWWDNDSTYRGKGIRNDFYFLSTISPLGEGEDEINRQWVHLSDELKSDLKAFLKKHNDSYGLQLPREDDLTSYDNANYLWLSYELINTIRNYNNAMRNPETHEVLPYCGQIPYVQLRIKSLASSVSSAYPSATVNQYGAALRPHYVIEFENSFLALFMKKLCELFDDNPQIVETKDGVQRVAYQFRAPIYRLKPFDKFFETRHDIPATIFHTAVKMLISHELAHVGLGHLDLNEKDHVFKSDVENIRCEENEADIQAVCWTIGARFLESENHQLELSLDDLAEELSLSVFTLYFLFTWNYSVDERVWNKDTLKEYGVQDHLPYQLRAYSALNTAICRLKHIGEWSEQEGMITSDNQPVTKKLMDEIIQEAMTMVHSYEVSLHMTQVKTEEVCELDDLDKKDEIEKMVRNEINERPPQLDKTQIPWMLGCEPEGQAELNSVCKRYQYVRQKLAESGTYCALRPGN